MLAKLGKFVLTMCLLFVPTMAWGQGLLIDERTDQQYRLPRPHFHPRPPVPVRPPQSYKIQSLKMGVQLQDQVAKVQVSQTFVNTGSRAMQVSFVFPLPYDGAVDRMTFLVDGKEYEAKVLGRDEARKIYEGYVRRNQDPALLEWMGTGMFKTSVFPVPPGASRTVTLRYSQICRKDMGVTELQLPLSTAKFTAAPLEELDVRVAITSQVNLKSVYSPSHSIDIKRPSKKSAVVHFNSKNQIPTSDFRLMFDVGKKKVGASVLTYRPRKDKDGYFLMLVSPDVQSSESDSVRKTVVFVVDRSGSMNGKKIEQAKDALKFVLNNLNQGDLFNVIAYDSTVESFRPELQRFNDETRAEALGFVEGIYAGGSTNINAALQTAMSQLKNDKQPNYVVFLTDGLPTTGETNEVKIVSNCGDHNSVRARLFSMGVGYDVNSRLLDKLARTNFGRSEYVQPNEDIEEHVSRLYSRIGAPALTHVQISFDLEGFPAEKGKPVDRVYPRDAYDLFAGDQLVLVGRYKRHGEAKVVIEGKVDGAKQKFDFPATLVKKSNDESYAFIEKIWAMRRVGEIIDEIDLNGKNNELVQELVELSRRHGILTPYTSFLADETTRLQDLAELNSRAGDRLELLNEVDGRRGVLQRLAKSEYQRAFRAPSGAQYGGVASESSKRLAQSGAGGGFGGGGLGGVGSPKPVPAAGRAAGANSTTRPAVVADREAETKLPSVQTFGSKTFYRRGDRWVDSTLTAEQEKSLRRVKRYGDEYFDLAKKLGKDAAKYLAMEGTVVVVFKEQAYLLEE